MTRVEQEYLTRVPERLGKIETHLSNIADCLEKLTEIAEKFYGKSTLV